MPKSPEQQRNDSMFGDVEKVEKNTTEEKNLNVGKSEEKYVSGAEELEALSKALDRERILDRCKDAVRGDPEKFALYKDISEVVHRGKITEWLATFLAISEIDTSILSGIVADLITNLKQSEKKPNMRGKFIRSFIMTEIQSRTKNKPAKIDPTDPRYSPNMRVSNTAVEKGYHHKKIGHT